MNGTTAVTPAGLGLEGSFVTQYPPDELASHQSSGDPSMKDHTAPLVRHLPLSVAPPHEPQSSSDPPMKGRSALAEHHLPLSLAPLHEPRLGAWPLADEPQHYLPHL